MATKTPLKKDNFAVILTGGKQYRVAEGEVITIEKLAGDLKAGDKVTFDQVLLTENGGTLKVGTPTISGAKVEAEYVTAGREKKITVIHYREKSRHFKKNGHRQPFAKIKITSIK